MAIVGGIDDAALDGSAGSGGLADSDIIRDVDPFKAARATWRCADDGRRARKGREDKHRADRLDDPNGNLPDRRAERGGGTVGSTRACGRSCSAWAHPRARRDQPGKGFDGTAGGRGRAGPAPDFHPCARWAQQQVLRFRVASGRDYVDQLKAMGAEILIPLPPDEKKCIIIRDLNNPSAQSVATNADFELGWGRSSSPTHAAIRCGTSAGTLGVECAGSDIPSRMMGVLPEGARG